MVAGVNPFFVIWTVVVAAPIAAAAASAAKTSSGRISRRFIAEFPPGAVVFTPTFFQGRAILMCDGRKGPVKPIMGRMRKNRRDMELALDTPRLRVVAAEPDRVTSDATDAELLTRV